MFTHIVCGCLLLLVINYTFTKCVFHSILTCQSYHMDIVAVFFACGFPPVFSTPACYHAHKAHYGILSSAKHSARFSVQCFAFTSCRDQTVRQYTIIYFAFMPIDNRRRCAVVVTVTLNRLFCQPSVTFAVMSLRSFRPKNRFRLCAVVYYYIYKIYRIKTHPYPVVLIVEVYNNLHP